MKKNTMIFALVISGLLLATLGFIVLNNQDQGQESANINSINDDGVIGVPTWNIGNKWFFSDENGNMNAYSVTDIIEENGSTFYVAEYVTDNDILQSYYSTEDLSIVRQKRLGDDTIVSFVPGIRPIPFPLDLVTNEIVDMTRTIYTKGVGRTNSFTIEYDVVGKERITVPAGTFETYRIQQTLNFDSMGLTEVVTDLWYSPRVKYLVKIQDNEGKISELMSYNIVQ